MQVRTGTPNVLPPLAFRLRPAFNPRMDTLLQPARHAPLHPRYDAIHRALLTGLLSNVGTKSDTHEYLGPRGMRFNIFPGSARSSRRSPSG